VTETVTVDPSLTAGLLDEVLDADAAGHPSADPPPRVPWLLEDGSPRWGTKADGTPRKSNPGTGRPPKANADDKARSTDRAPEPPKEEPKAHSSASSEDYTDDIGGALTMIWMGLAATPWTKGHAAVVRLYTPQMAPAWNTAAQQNATVRKYVKKLSGEGSWGWVLPVTIVTTPLLTGFWQVTRDRDLRAQLAAQTEKDFATFLQEQARAAGMDVDSSSGTSTSTEAGPSPSGAPPE
jgi:hypothetical protein